MGRNSRSECDRTPISACVRPISRIGRRRAGPLARRATVGPGVVADPVAFCVCSLCAGARVTGQELVANHEKGSAHAAARQHVDLRGDGRLRPVVERHRHIEHAHASVVAPRIKSEYFSADVPWPRASFVRRSSLRRGVMDCSRLMASYGVGNREGAMAEQFRAQKEIIGQSTIQASKEIWSRLCNSWGETQRGCAAAT